MATISTIYPNEICDFNSSELDKRNIYKYFDQICYHINKYSTNHISNKDIEFPKFIYSINKKIRNIRKREEYKIKTVVLIVQEYIFIFKNVENINLYTFKYYIHEDYWFKNYEIEITDNGKNIKYSKMFPTKDLDKNYILKSYQFWCMYFDLYISNISDIDNIISKTRFSNLYMSYVDGEDKNKIIRKESDIIIIDLTNVKFHRQIDFMFPGSVIQIYENQLSNSGTRLRISCDEIILVYKDLTKKSFFNLDDLSDVLNVKIINLRRSTDI